MKGQQQAQRGAPGNISPLYLILPVILIVAGEWIYRSNHTHLSHVLSSLVQLPIGDAGVHFATVHTNTSSSPSPSSSQAQVFAFQDVHVAVKDVLVDEALALAFPNVFHLARVTEYCQWHEDMIQSNGTAANGTRANNTRQYAYRAAWSHRIINSALFNDSRGHDNPQNDPFPSNQTSQHVWVGVRQNGTASNQSWPDATLFVNWQRLDAIAPETYRLSDITSNAYNAHTLQTLYKLGVAEIRGDWLYVRAAGFAPRNNSARNHTAECTVGEIRLKFKVKKVPDTMSFVASVRGRELVPFEGTFLHAVGSESGDSLVQTSIRNQQMIRVGFWVVAILLFIALFPKRGEQGVKSD